MTRKEFITVTKATVKEFGKDDVPLLAAGLTYYAFFSLFPLLLLAVSLVGVFADPTDAATFVFTNVSQYAPGSGKLLQGAVDEAFKHRASAGILAVIGAGVLVFSASNAFSTLDKAINRAWGSEKVPNLLIGKLISFGMMLGVAGLLVLSVIVSTILQASRAAAENLAGGVVPNSDIFWQLALNGVSLGLVFLVFLLMFRFMPRHKVNMRDVWPGALLAAVAWVIVKELFALYLGSSLANYEAVYGPLGTVIALLTWIYVSSLIILSGAEFAAETFRVRRMREQVSGGVTREAAARPKESPWFSGVKPPSTATGAK